MHTICNYYCFLQAIATAVVLGHYSNNMFNLGQILGQ